MEENACSYRMATLEDKDVVLALRDLKASLMEYLTVRYDEFVADPNRICIVAETRNEVVAFVVLYFIDGGETMSVHSAMVKEGFEGRGHYKRLLEHCDTLGRQRGCIRKATGVFRTNTAFLSSKNSYKVNQVKNCFYRKAAAGSTGHSQGVPSHQLTTVTNDLLDEYTGTPCFRKYLFPLGFIHVDRFNYYLTEGNMQMLKAYKTKFISSLALENGEVKGLLSSVSFHDTVVHLDTYGHDSDAIDEHIRYCLLEFPQLLNEDAGWLLQVVTDEGMDKDKVSAVLEQYNLQTTFDSNVTCLEAFVVEQPLVL